MPPLSKVLCRHDALIVVGDVSDDLGLLEEASTLSIMGALSEQPSCVPRDAMLLGVAWVSRISVQQLWHPKASPADCSGWW